MIIQKMISTNQHGATPYELCNSGDAVTIDMAIVTRAREKWYLSR